MKPLKSVIQHGKDIRKVKKKNVRVSGSNITPKKKKR